MQERSSSSSPVFDFVERDFPLAVGPSLIIGPSIHAKKGGEGDPNGLVDIPSLLSHIIHHMIFPKREEIMKKI